MSRVEKKSALDISINVAQTKMTGESNTSSSDRASTVLVVADDLTGACDAGVQFARSGVSSVVELSAGAAPLDAAVRILNSRSRHRVPEAAAEEVERLMRCAARVAATICFKKVDSTLRGNIVAESKAMMRAAGLDLAVLAPALPSQGRTVVGGILQVRDCTGSRSVDVRVLLSSQGLDSVAILPPEDAATAAKMAQQILALRAAGAELILCDSETEEDLQRIARTLAQLPRPPLWVGSAGLAKYAAQVLSAAGGPSLAQDIGDADLRPAHASAPILFCVGSDHPVTLLQLRRLIESGAAGTLDAQTATTDEVRQIIRAGRHALLPLPDTKVDRGRICRIIAAARSAGICAAFLSGGTTAEFVCDAIDATAIRLRDEAAPGIPWGIIRGGVLDGLPVATKAGGFGEESALIAMGKLLGTIESQAR